METINSLAINWWKWMAPMFLQVSLLILIISAIDRLLQKWIWPQIRYGLWILVLVKLIIPPSFHLPTGIVSNSIPKVQKQINTKWEESTFTKTFDIISNEMVPKEITSKETIPLYSDKQPDISRSEINNNPKPVWQAYAMVIHLAGIIFFISLLLIKIRKLRKWHKEQETRKNIPEWFYHLLVNTANRLKMNKIPGIVFSNKAVSPAVYGIFNPVLLLPDNYIDNLSEEEAEHVFLHELAHIRRGDLYLHGINLGLQIIYWFNPLLIWVTRQTRHVRELCCDTTVANYLKENTSDYRQTLLKTVRELLTESLEPGLALLGVFEEPFRLVSRLKWLDKKIWGKRKKMMVSSLLVSLVFGFIFLPMAGRSLKGNNPRFAEVRENIKNEKDTMQWWVPILLKHGIKNENCTIISNYCIVGKKTTRDSIQEFSDVTMITPVYEGNYWLIISKKATYNTDSEIFVMNNCIKKKFNTYSDPEKPLKILTHVNIIKNMNENSVLISIPKFDIDIIRTYSKKMNRLLMNEQYDSLLTFYHEDMIVMPNYGPAIRGIENIKKQYDRDKKNKVDIISSSAVILNLKQCRNKIYETGIINMVVKTQKSNFFQEDSKYLTIWEVQEDGSFKVKFSMWNSNKSLSSYQ